jgi:hypothetical protein
MNTEFKSLKGHSIYTRRHHGATKIAFSPVDNRLLAIFGGPNGMIIYKL